MADDDCKYIIDESTLPDDVKVKYWEEMTQELQKIQDGRDNFSPSEIENIIENFTREFVDRAQRIKFTRAIIRSNGNKLKMNLENNPKAFLTKLARNIESYRDAMMGEGEFFIRGRLEQMSDNGVKFKAGLLDEHIAFVDARIQSGNKNYVHPDPDVMIGYKLIKDFDQWDLETQLINGVAIEKLHEHTLKLENDIALLIDNEEEWVASQKKWRDLNKSYGPRATELEIDAALREEYRKIVDKTYNNSSRPNRLMSRGAVYKQGKIILHNKRWGSGTSHDSMLKTLRRTANDSSMQKFIPVEKADQKGMSIKDPEPTIQAIVNLNLEDTKLRNELIKRVEDAAKNEVSPHITELVTRAAKELENLSKLRKDAGGKRKKELEKQIVFLQNYTTRMNLERKLDDFIGRALKGQDLNNNASKAAQTLNTLTKATTSPLLARGPIAAIYDVIPKFAQNVDFYGNDPRALVYSFIDSLASVFYGTGDNFMWKFKREAVSEIEDFLEFTLSYEESFKDMIGIGKKPSDVFEDSNFVIRNGMRLMDKLGNLQFAMNFIHHMNKSSFYGSIWSVRKKLNKALMELVPSEKAAHLYATLGLNEFDIVKLQSMMVDGQLNKKLLRKDPILFNKVQKGFIKEAFLGTPRNDARANDIIGKSTIWGQKPLRSEGPFRRALYNARTALIKTPISAVANTFEALARNADTSTKKGRRDLVKNAAATLKVMMLIGGMKNVLYQALRVDYEKEGITGRDAFNEYFLRHFIDGALGMEYLGPFRDLIVNALSGNEVGISRNFLGPVGSTIYSTLRTGGEYVYQQHQLNRGEIDELDVLSTSAGRNMVKRMFIGFNIPFIDAYTDELIVHNLIELLEPDAIDDWKDKMIEKEQIRRDAWEEVEDIGTYWDYKNSGRY
jgi:hypothetical protein